jgi:hypothetical protein
MVDNSFGLTTWGEPKTTFDRSQNSDDRATIPFARLKDGSNVMRIVTPPYKYHQIRFKAQGEKGFGRRVNTAWPKYDDCPAKLAGFYPKKRYLVGVIDRRDEDIKILDMSILVYEQLQRILKVMKEEDGKDHQADEFDICIDYDSKASTPAAFYQTMQRPVKPLNDADLELLKAKKDDLDEALLRHSTPPPPDVVRKRMEALGWQGESAPRKTKDDGGNGTSKQENLKETEEADYSFQKPAQAEATTN